MIELTPTVRKAVYGVIAAFAGILMVAGTLTDSQVVVYLAYADAGLGVIALILAAIKARRVDVTVIYTTTSGLLAALVVGGIAQQALADEVMKLVTALLTALPLVLAAYRTNTSVPSGNPEDGTP